MSLDKEQKKEFKRLKDTINYLRSFKTHGILDYSDLDTISNPIAVTGGGGTVFLTNDGAGAFTNKLHLPTGVTDVWDVNNQQFDFSQLKLGSKIDIRLDCIITTTAPNTEVVIDLELGIGGSTYDLSWLLVGAKTAGTYSLVRTSFVYMGDTNTMTNPAKFKISSDANISVVVNGWACFVDLY